MKNRNETTYSTVDSRKACETLRISANTLYAYVSRGMVRAIADPGDARKSLYDRRDIDQLLARKQRGRSRRAVAESTIDWGEPVLASNITRIADGTFYYCGTSAIDLSETATLEDILRLIANVHDLPADGRSPDLSALDKLEPLDRILRMMAAIATQRRRSDGRKQAGRLLRLSAQSATGSGHASTMPVHALLAQAWSQDERASDLVRRALVLCADHELNASTYATRVAASAGASLPACLLVGLATLSGSRHGGMTSTCRTWVRTVRSATSDVAPLSQVKPPPGFGHALYPEGDPRAKALFQACGSPAQWQEIIHRVHKETGARPNLDFGLALLEETLGLPRGAGLGLFAIGRMAGWIAHIFEQRQTGKLIRPRASSGVENGVPQYSV